MPLVTAKGEEVKLDLENTETEFARAMAAPAADEPAAPAPPRKSPGSPGRPRKSADDKTRTRARSSSPAKPAESPEDAAQRRASGIAGLIQLTGGLALVMDTRTPDSDLSWRADAVTLANSAEPLGQAMADAAKSSAQFAAVVDKLTQVGPWGGLITVTLGIGAQLARNHGVKMAESFGAVPPEMLLAALDEPKAA